MGLELGSARCLVEDHRPDPYLPGHPYICIWMHVERMCEHECVCVCLCVMRLALFFEYSLCAKHYVEYFIFNAPFSLHDNSGKKIL